MGVVTRSPSRRPIHHDSPEFILGYEYLWIGSSLFLSDVLFSVFLPRSLKDEGEPWGESMNPVLPTSYSQAGTDNYQLQPSSKSSMVRP